MVSPKSAIRFCILLISLALLGQFLSARDAGLEIRWEIVQGPRSDNKRFLLTLEHGQLTIGNLTRAVSAEEQSELVTSLKDADIWTLDDFQELQPDIPVVETLLYVKLAGKESNTNWRGVSLPQMRIVDALCCSAIGDEAREGVSRFLQSLPKNPHPQLGFIERLEILLAEVPAARVALIMEYKHPNCRVQKHPSLNGFYIDGSRRDVLSIKSEIGSLDRVPFLR